MADVADSTRKLAKPMPSAEYLRECFDYDPTTGSMRWRTRPLSHFPDERAWKIWKTKNVGRGPMLSNAGALYFNLKHHGGIFQVHRLAWKLMTGEDPEHEVDHDDGCRQNNKWINLRSADRSQNQANVGVISRNSSGYRGVSPLKGRWRAQISVHGTSRKRHIGVFDTREQALAAYEAEAKRAWPDFYKSQVVT